MLDDLYWVMSYSRWKDERYWPAFRDALLKEHPSLNEAGLVKAREFNFQRYHFQGIGRYAPEAAYARGLADLAVLAHRIPAEGYVHGPKPTGIDAGIYGFIANIYLFDIDTPLRQFVVAHDNLSRHCRAIHARCRAGAVIHAGVKGAEARSPAVIEFKSPLMEPFRWNLVPISVNGIAIAPTARDPPHDQISDLDGGSHSGLDNGVGVARRAGCCR